MPKLGMEVIRRRQVIEAVVKILQTHGWRDLTIREVAEVAGVSAGIVTHYFGSKRAMTIDAIAEAHTSVERKLRENVRKHINPISRLVAAVDTLISGADQGLPDMPFWLSIWGRMAFDKVVQAEMQGLHRRQMELICETINEGMRAGVFVPRTSPADIAIQVLAQASGLALLSVMNPAELSPRRAKDLLLRLLARELQADFGPTLAFDAFDAKTGRQ